MLGVSVDPPEANRAFAAKYEFPFRLLSDTSRRMCLDFRACERADDAFARRVTYMVGPDGNIEAAVETSDPGGQATALLADCL